MWDAGASKSMTRVNVLLMNRGNGPGFPPCPRAKSAPLPEYSTVFNRSAPMARDAFVMTVLASCAAARQAITERSTTASALSLRIHPST